MRGYDGNDGDGDGVGVGVERCVVLLVVGRWNDFHFQ